MPKAALKTLLLIYALSPLRLQAALSQTSYASWYSTITTNGLGHVNVYALQANTTINLYRVLNDDTTIGGAPAATWTSTIANEPFHFPVVGGPNNDAVNWFSGTERSYYRLVATHPTAPAGTNLVNWDLNSPDRGGYLDAHTMIVSENGTYAGNLFHTYLFYNDGNAGNNTRGMSIGVINVGATPINIQVNRWNGAAWVAAPASATGASNFAGLAADRIWMYGGVTNATIGDYQVIVTGGTASVYKGCMFELDNDNAFMMMTDVNGYKVGNTLYGAMGRTVYGADPGSLVLTAIGGASTVDVYTYNYSGTAAFPAVPGGGWTLWAGAVNVAAGTPVSLSPGMNGLPALSGNGQFVKVVVTGGAQVQAGVGANVLSGVAGDGDWVAAADTSRPLGRLFYCTNGNYSNNLGLSQNNNPRIVVIAPTAGTQITISSPGKPNQNWTSAGADQAHSFPIDYLNGNLDENRIWTVTSSNYNVYCFFETAGTSTNDMEKMYSAVAPVPGVDLLIDKSVDKLQANPGENLTYTLAVTNIGSEDALNVQLWDTIPAGLNFVSDSQAGFVTSPGVPGSTARIWTFPTVAGNGGSVTVVLTVQVDPSQPTGSMVFANSANTFAANDPRVRVVDRPVLSFAIAQSSGCREAWATWENNPTSGSHQEGYLHVYAQRDGTTFTLRDASNLDAGAPPMAINTNVATINLNAGETYSYPASQGALPGGGGGFNTRFFKIESNYPVSWEIESQNASDRMGHQMMVNSMDGRFSDNAPFFTYLDYYHKDCGGPPKCWDSSRYGDAMVVINPNTGAGQDARFQAFNSFDNGATWNFVGDYVVAPEGAVLIGGTTQATDGDWLVVPYRDAAQQGRELIVYKGSSINKTSETQNSGALYGASENGTKQAGAGQAIYGLAGTGSGPNIIVTALAAGTSYQIYQYTPATAPGADWPIAGNSGTWTSVATGGPLALGASGSYTTPADGLYKVEVTAGTASALFGSNMFTNFAYGDGDMVASLDNGNVDWLSGQTNSIFKGRDFRFTSGPQSGGNIQVIAPNAGTTVQITGGSLNLGGGSGRTTSASPPASSVDDQAWRWEISQANAAYRVTSSDDVIVIMQDRGNDHVAKAYAGMPLVLCIVQTPTFTPTATATPSRTATRTASPTATPSPTPTASPTATSSRTPSASPTASPSASPTRTATQTYTPSATDTASPTQTLTRTPTFTATDTITPGPTPTFTLTYSFTHTRTDSPTPSPSATSTHTATDTFTRTHSPSITPTVTHTTPFSPTNTPTITVTFTPSSTFTGTETFSATFTATASASASTTLTVSPTFSHTATPSASASPTPTRTDSPTATFTRTATLTHTPTMTFSASPTPTESFTISPTFTPAPPLRAKIEVYNAAGERVGVIADDYGIYMAPLGLEPLIPAFAPDSGGFATIMILGPGQSVTWDGTNSNGGIVEGGSYYVKMELKDNFGKVSSFQTQVTVIRQALGVEIEIFNSAGERVWHAGLTSTASASALAVSDKTLLASEDGSSSIVFSWGSLPGQSVAWDGRNAEGQQLATGTYNVRLRDSKTGSVHISSVAVLQAPGSAGITAVAWPSPLQGSKSKLTITLNGATPFTSASARIYNLAGELVGAAVNAPNFSSIVWEASRISGGIYLVSLDFETLGVRQRSSLKIVVLN